MATHTKLITYDDYRSLPDDGKRYEIIGGELFMTESPRILHQIISLNLASELYNYVSERGLGRVLEASTDVVLSMTDIVQPDILFVSSERSHIITEKNIVEAPDLVVEIISEGTKIIDQSRKKDLYEKHGVKEYWIVYPDEKKVEQYVLRDKAFELKNELTGLEKLSAEVIDGFTVTMHHVFSDS